MALAIDTPGYGLSDALAIEQPDVGNYAESLAETLDEMGIAECALFGSHTGATIAIEFARRYPDRVSVAIFDGYPAWPDDRRAEMSRNYFPPWRLEWSGLHLVDFFLRYREMNIYWPWYDQRKETRAASSGGNLEMTHRIALAGIMAGQNYYKGYAAVFRYNEIEAVNLLKVPACFAGRAEDSLVRSLDLVGELPKNCWKQVLPPDDSEAAKHYIKIIDSYIPKGRASIKAYNECIPGKISKHFLEWSEGDILVRQCGKGTTLPLVIIPHVPGSSASYEPLILAFSAGRRVVAIDPPGNGDSDLDYVLSLEQQAQAIAEVLSKLELGPINLYAHNGGCSIAATIAKNSEVKVSRLILDGPMLLPPDVCAAVSPNYAPLIALEKEGGHLLKLWRALRNEQLYWPWYNETFESVRVIEPDIAPDALTTRVVGILKQYRNYTPTYEMLFADNLYERLKSLTCPTLICAAENDVFADYRVKAAEIVENSLSQQVPVPAVDKAETISQFLDG